MSQDDFPIYEFDSCDYGVQNWHTLIEANFQKVEEYLCSRRLITLGETVAAGQPLYPKADGKWYKAQANGAKQPCLGLAVESGLTNEQIRLQRKGPLTVSGWNWITGKPVYLSATPGTLTQSRPETHAQLLGFATGATTIYLEGNILVDGLALATTTTTTTSSSSTTTTTAV